MHATSDDIIFAEVAGSVPRTHVNDDRVCLTVLQVISKREDAAPMQMTLAGEIDSQKGFELQHGGYSKSQQKNNMKAQRFFIPPCTIRFSTSSPLVASIH